MMLSGYTMVLVVFLPMERANELLKKEEFFLTFLNVKPSKLASEGAAKLLNGCTISCIRTSGIVNVLHGYNTSILLICNDL